MNQEKSATTKETSVILTEGLVTTIVDITNSSTVNSAIELAIRTVLSDGTLPRYTKSDIPDLLPDNNGENWSTTHHMRNSKKTVKIKLSEKLLDDLKDACSKKYPTMKTLSDKIDYCLTTIIVEYQKAKLISPLHLPGSKWYTMRPEVQSALAGREYARTVETCMGALGIFCAVDCADTVILNDFDIGKYHLYRELTSNSVRLINNFLREVPSVEKYKNFKKILRKIGSFSTEKQDSGVTYSGAEIAGMYLYENYYCKSRRPKDAIPLHNKPSLGYICSLLKIGERLRGKMESDTLRKVKLYNKDLLELIPRYNRADTLIICDPPYPYTGSYDDNLTIAQHYELGKLLKRHKGDFIYFCRLTEREHNQIFYSPRIRALLTDIFIPLEDSEKKARIYYFKDVYTADGWERIIASFNFDGATPYTVEADIQAKKKSDAEDKVRAEEKAKAKQQKDSSAMEGGACNE